MPFEPPTQSELESQVIYNRLQSHHQPWRFFLRAVTMSRAQAWLVSGGIVAGAAYFLGPWLWDEMQELLHRNYLPVDPSHMPHMSPMWWENEWRKMNPVWRRGESVDGFHLKPYRYVLGQTGRDLSSAESFVASSPGQLASEKMVSWGWRSPSAGALAVEPVRALVPLCGDSPIIKTLAMQGYHVDAVDCSPTAIQAAVMRNETALPLEAYPRIHLHWSDFFAPELWSKTLAGRKYDVIYERQGITSINREQRPDYAYLLKQALKESGVLYVEGMFRTGRVKGNKVLGPPYSLSRKELEHLFPVCEGYHVRCEERSDEMTLLSREQRLVQIVPRELYTTPFSCVVFKSAAVNLAARDAAAAETPMRSPPSQTAAREAVSSTA